MTDTTLTAPTVAGVAGRSVRAATPIPTTRLVAVELRKMFDTRAGFWLVAGIGIVSLLATAAVLVFAPRAELTYETFASAIGAPMSILLPVVAILALTSEWSQRSGLTTFTLVPHRGRVIAAKAVAVLGVAVASMLLAAAVGALGNVVGTAIAGVDTTWNVSLAEFGQIVLANVIGMGIGFMLAVLLRSSAGAIVGYFVYTALLPTISSALASTQDWWRDNGAWIDVNYATSALYSDSMTGEQWAQLGVTTLVWLWIPLALGLRAVLRAEVK
ncbi:ABC transporter permease subunit [Nocardioides sp. zg-1228]|uniref:ABC transporter permease subunit n=1 Tax=Nocardioides sp. zg-1228 TaxID=2763008 RepID=UPI001642CDAA|nr:ABC transporter permease subunit [Nocardioides sp. zg-1228]MBC2931754.1 ABC transporter permease subunit [Nocardioides sp. zg-1228]QSF57337.1 ABC transporter permease subunit [Nocardioides sp. zg-1228]